MGGMAVWGGESLGAHDMRICVCVLASSIGVWCVIGRGGKEGKGGEEET